MSIGMTVTSPAQTLAVMVYLPAQDQNMASSALNTTRQTGGVIGVALLGAIVTGNLAAQTPLALTIAIAACIIAALAALWMIPRTNACHPHKKQIAPRSKT